MRRPCSLDQIAMIVLLTFASLGYAKEVVVIGTIHGDHKRFPLFNFDTIRIALEHIKPDILFIEEDPKTFSEKLYEKLSEEEYGKIRPVEIKKVLIPFAQLNKVKVVPTDWRVGYDEKVEELYKNTEKDDFFKAVQHPYMSLFMDDYLTTSIYDFHSDKFMAVLEGRNLLYNSIPKYKAFRQLDTKRQKIINQNVVDGLKKHSFKTAVVVYGVSHRPAIVRAINRASAAKVLTLQEAMKPRVDGVFEREIKNIYE